MEENIDYRQLYEQLKSELSLEVDYARLTVTEKLAKLLSAIAILLIMLFVAASLLVIVSWSAIQSLAEHFKSIWAGAGIVLGVLVVIFLILWVFRKQVIVNPIVRYISKLLIDPPGDKNE